MPICDLLQRRETHFVLWAPQDTLKPPELIIGQFAPGNPPSLSGAQRIALTRAAGVDGLWEVAAAACNLRDGQVYHYWFEVDDTSPHRELMRRFLCTDPAAFTVDWRLLADRLPRPYTEGDRQPAAVIRYRDGRLEGCDAGGETGDFTGEPPPDQLPPNDRLVIYELPTAWTGGGANSVLERAVGTFQDVLALVDTTAGGANFSDLAVLQPGQAHLKNLGVNALELLPPADSAYRREWGYGTSNFLAPDHELGLPEGYSWPTSNRDLAALVLACHKNGIRFFVDVVMAFARQNPYEAIDYGDFHICGPGDRPHDPDAWTSGRAGGGKEIRNGFGSTLFRYARPVRTYDPDTGQDAEVFPARQLMCAALDRWSRDFHIDGIRMDSVENVANWDFIQTYKDRAHARLRDRWIAQNLAPGADNRMLVVGEELSVPLDLVKQGRLDGLWNDHFRALIRPALLGRNGDNEPSFEWTVRNAIDCRNVGFSQGVQAINYLTSHDVEGYRRERLYNFFRSADVGDIEKRIKLGFVCLLTAVGIPMILAGEEFADEHDLFDRAGHVTQGGGKQIDPVNYSRLADPMRQRVYQYVARLVKLRTRHPALASDETVFFRVDFDDGKRVLVWRRGTTDNPVVVVANFSDFMTPNPASPTAEYPVPGWPAAPAGKSWREVTQNRPVPPQWVAREPIYPWEAKVYELK